MNNLFLKRTDYFELFDYTETLISEHFSRWADIALKNDGYIPNIEKYIHELGVEGKKKTLMTFLLYLNQTLHFYFLILAQAILLLGKGFNKHRSKIEASTKQFYHYSKTLWDTNMKMQIIPSAWAQKLNLRVWKDFSEANRQILKMG